MGGGGDEFAEFEAVLVNPAAVGLLAGEFLLDLVVVAEDAGSGVRGKHLPGAEAAFASDDRVIEHDSARFGADVEEAVGGGLVARGAKAVAVEGGADLGAVGEDEADGAVPWLGEGADVLVEGAEFVGDVLVVAVGRRHQHAHRVLG